MHLLIGNLGHHFRSVDCPFTSPFKSGQTEVAQCSVSHLLIEPVGAGPDGRRRVPHFPERRLQAMHRPVRSLGALLTAPAPAVTYLRIYLL